MTYQAQDILPHGGQPVELYEFTANNTVYRYAAVDEDVTTAGSLLWEGAILSRNGFTVGTGVERAGVNVTASTQLPFLEVFEDGFPEGAVQLKIYRTHVTDPDKEIRLLWEGEVTSREFQHKSVVLKGEAPEVALRSLGLRRMYQRPCPYPLYRGGCGVDRALHQVNDVVASVNGAKISMTLQDCSPFSGGYVARTIGGRIVTRFVENGEGDLLTLKQEASWITNGVTLNMYPGCNKTPEICASRFDNILNFGGFKDMPIDNPFNTQVY